MAFVAVKRPVSRGDHHQFALAISSKGETRTDVFFGKIWNVMEDLFLRHVGSEIIEDAVNGYTEPPNTRLSAALPGLDRDVLLVVHNRNIRSAWPEVKH